jgi:predicted phosphodiesterase
LEKIRNLALLGIFFFYFLSNPLLYATSPLVFTVSPQHAPKNNQQIMVSPFEGSLLLGAPEPDQISANILAKHPSHLYLAWGPSSKEYTRKSSVAKADSQNPAVFVMNCLQPGKKYFYRLYFKKQSENSYHITEEYSFHTPRLPGQSFTFTIQSDSHLINRADQGVYRQTLEAMAQFHPDFLIDLGDTFIHDAVSQVQHPPWEKIQEPYLQQRPFFDIVSRNASVFLTLGNHDGEAAEYFDVTDKNLAVMATRARKKYFPNPQVNTYYSGNEEVEDFVGNPQNYYAFEWGDALIVVLDYYRYKNPDQLPSDNPWSWTLGKTQYDWFLKTLENSKARYKFVFAHHANGIGRGGKYYSKLFEWGGYNANGKYLFDEMRPAWGKPIHQIMKDNGVNIFFQGHDHVFAMEDVDGIVYQTLPRPSEKKAERLKVFVLYPDAHLLLNSGFLKVDVSAKELIISYYRSYFVSTDPQLGNTGIVFSYALDSEGKLRIIEDKQDDLSKYVN